MPVKQLDDTSPLASRVHAPNTGGAASEASRTSSTWTPVDTLDAIARPTWVPAASNRYRSTEATLACVVGGKLTMALTRSALAGTSIVKVCLASDCTESSVGRRHAYEPRMVPSTWA